MLRLLQKRDFKEADIDTVKQAMLYNELQKEKFKFHYEEKLQNYQKWKKDNKLEGLKY